MMMVVIVVIIVVMMVIVVIVMMVIIIIIIIPIAVVLATVIPVFPVTVTAGITGTQEDKTQKNQDSHKLYHLSKITFSVARKRRKFLCLERATLAE